eukprot:4349166-Prymnesium_polylepis.1
MAGFENFSRQACELLVVGHLVRLLAPTALPSARGVRGIEAGQPAAWSGTLAGADAAFFD